MAWTETWNEDSESWDSSTEVWNLTETSITFAETLGDSLVPIAVGQGPITFAGTLGDSLISIGTAQDTVTFVTTLEDLLDSITFWDVGIEFGETFEDSLASTAVGQGEIVDNVAQTVTLSPISTTLDNVVEGSNLADGLAYELFVPGTLDEGFVTQDLLENLAISDAGVSANLVSQDSLNVVGAFTPGYSEVNTLTAISLPESSVSISLSDTLTCGDIPIGTVVGDTPYTEGMTVLASEYSKLWVNYGLTEAITVLDNISIEIQAVAPIVNDCILTVTPAAAVSAFTSAALDLTVTITLNGYIDGWDFNYGNHIAVWQRPASRS